MGIAQAESQKRLIYRRCFDDWQNILRPSSHEVREPLTVTIAFLEGMTSFAQSLPILWACFTEESSIATKKYGGAEISQARIKL